MRSHPVALAVVLACLVPAAARAQAAMDRLRAASLCRVLELRDAGPLSSFGVVELVREDQVELLVTTWEFVEKARRKGLPVDQLVAETLEKETPISTFCRPAPSDLQAKLLFAGVVRTGKPNLHRLVAAGGREVRLEDFRGTLAEARKRAAALAVMLAGGRRESDAQGSAKLVAPRIGDGVESSGWMEAFE